MCIRDSAVAEHYGVELRNVLTGFKWIGDQIAGLEAAGEVDRFIFGFEESYGYLAGPYVRDKDAIIGSMLICEMAAYYRSIGSSLKQRMEEIYSEYGRYLNKIDSFEFPGPVSYTHLDVYKRQILPFVISCVIISLPGVKLNSAGYPLI